MSYPPNLSTENKVIGSLLILNALIACQAAAKPPDATFHGISSPTPARGKTDRFNTTQIQKKITGGGILSEAKNQEAWNMVFPKRNLNLKKKKDIKTEKRKSQTPRIDFPAEIASTLLKNNVTFTPDEITQFLSTGDRKMSDTQ